MSLFSSIAQFSVITGSMLYNISFWLLATLMFHLCLSFFLTVAALPWTPKVRPKDIDQFLDTTRIKFVGFMLPNDRVSLAGLPPPIHEGVRVLKEVKPWIRKKAVFLCSISNNWEPFSIDLIFNLTLQHMYLSLTEIQIQKEEDINRNPVSKGVEDIVLTPPEVLYQVLEWYERRFMSIRHLTSALNNLGNAAKFTPIYDSFIKNFVGCSPNI